MATAEEVQNAIGTAMAAAVSVKLPPFWPDKTDLWFVQADAQFLPFEDNSIDCITIAFGLRNVTDKARALRSMHRVLKPGGRVLVLEFSKPTSPLLSKVYDAYSFSALPVMGKLITDDADSYRYLAESIRKTVNTNYGQQGSYFITYFFE